MYTTHAFLLYSYTIFRNMFCVDGYTRKNKKVEIICPIQITQMFTECIKQISFAIIKLSNVNHGEKF
jgi:hypothetical protein